MRLNGVMKREGWLWSEWTLTYGVSWDMLCKGAQQIYSTMSNPEILVEDEPVTINTPEDILTLEEAARLTVRGYSNILKTAVSLTFYNQLRLVRSYVLGNDEFAQADYEAFNKAMTQFMDSIEIQMHMN